VDRGAAYPGDVAEAHNGPRGIGTALRFLAAARREQPLRERLAAIEPEDGLEPVIAAAADAGYTLDAASLRAAFTADWGLRTARYAREHAPAHSAASTVAEVNRPSSST
jgi:hypothetical protein